MLHFTLERGRFKYTLAQEITNRAILTQVENRKKSDTSAEDYLQHVTNNFPSALSLQCIPTNASLWKMDRYEDFLAERRSILAKKLNEFLDGITDVPLGEGTVDILDTIAEGEHDALEFKSSLRWDIEKRVFNKDLEVVVLKSIAAFSNGLGDGGILIIGVDDEHNVLGLEGDYSTLKDGGGRDTFERHLRSLVIKQWGVEFSANLKISFEEVSGEDICVIDVKRGRDPLYLITNDKNGTQVERFYVRSGNSSQPIAKISEISEYVNHRFQS